MASTSFLLLCSPIKSFDPFSRTRTIKPKSNNNINRRLICAGRREAHDHDFSGRLVDEGMIVLRKRIHESKMIDMNNEPPKEWMDWEKRLYAGYDSIICDAMGHLQSYLMETRPSLALATIGLIALSVPASSAVVLYNMLMLANGALSGIHMS